MWVFLPYLLPLTIVVLANLGVTRRSWRLLTYACLALLHTVTLLVGLLLLSMPALVRLTETPLSPELEGFRFVGLGLGLTLTAGLGFASLVAPLRRPWARWLPIDPDSPVHVTALTFILYLGSTSLVVLLSAGEALRVGLEMVRIDSTYVVGSQVVFLLFALAGVGLGTRRDVRQTLARLGLRRPAMRDLAIAAIMVAAFLTLDYAASLLWHRLWPASYQAVTDVSEQLFVRFASPYGALLLGLSAGIGEETLFRGALQPRFGIPLTALIFTVGHVQYALSPAMVEVLIIGLALGWLRERSNTTTCVAVHAAYNFLDLLIMPLFP
jgi:hypothetical protein